MQELPILFVFFLVSTCLIICSSRLEVYFINSFPHQRQVESWAIKRQNQRQMRSLHGLQVRSLM